MSKTVDERVVEMRFDNQQFERNISTTMSTLDKFKQKLNLTGASKGLENVSAAANKIDMSGLGNAVQTVSARFSALQVMGVTALANITNSAVNAGKRITNALTLEPVMTGFNEYELKMNSVQTIMASTGESLATVNQYLAELNEYSDKTIYSFADMTQNIGKFTNAGVKLEDAVAAIKGISNEAAVSGANANEASRAMYNFAQALSAGYVKLIDWKSIENANMATVEFKEQLIETAVEMGTLTKVTDGYETAEGKVITATKNFNDSLQDQWMTSDVLVKTLSKYADETTDIGKKASQAATEVKTFTQLFDTLKESAQSGWAQTWELLVGDFEESKELMTGLSKSIGGLIDGMSDWRNNLVSGAVTSNWEKLSSVVEKAGLSTEDYLAIIKETYEAENQNGESLDALIEKYGSLKKVIQAGEIPANIFTTALKKLLGIEDGLTESTEKMTASLEDYKKIAKRVINGEFGDGETRIKKLTEAGYDYAKVQNLVNELLGSSTRHTEKLTEAQISNADSLVKLSDEQLKEKGYTEEQIKALRELEQAANGAGTSIDELINNMGKPSGRELLIQTFKNLGTVISNVFETISKAWNNVFDDELDGNDIYSFLETLRDITGELAVTSGEAENFQKIFQGLFAGFKLGGTLASKTLIGGLKILNAVLDVCGTDLLTIAGNIADCIYQFEKWLDLETIFGWDTAYTDLANIIVAVYEGIKKCVKAFFGLKEGVSILEGIKEKFKGMFEILTDFLSEFDLKGIVNKINSFFNSIESWIKDGHDFSKLGSFIADGLWEGLTSGGKKIIESLLDIGRKMYQAFCDFFGIASPAKLMIAAGGFIIAGLVLGLTNSFPVLWETVKGIVTGFVDILSNIDVSTVIAGVIGTGVLLLAKRILDIIEMFGSGFAGFGEFMNGLAAVPKKIANLFESMGDWFKAKVWEARANVVLTFAKAIGILAVALVALTYVDQDRLWSAVGAISVLAIVVGGLAAVAAMIKDVKLSSVMIGASMSGIGMAILMLSGALKILSTIDPEAMKSSMIMFAEIVIGLGALMVAFGYFVKGDAARYANRIGKMFTKMSIALLIMAGAMKIVASMSAGDLVKGAAFVAGIGVLFAGLVALSVVTKGHVSKVGGMAVKMGIAMGIMVGVFKLVSLLSASEIAKGIAFVAGVEALFAGLMLISNLGKNGYKVGGTILAMSVAMIAITTCIKMISGMTGDEILKGLGVVAALEVLFAGLIWVSQYAGQHAMKAGVMLLAMSGALLILSAAMYLLGELPIEKAAKAIGVITILELLFGGLIFLSKYSKDCAKTVLNMGIAIAILAGVVLALSLIKEERLGPAVGAVATLMAVFGAMIGLTHFAKNTKQMIRTLYSMVGVVALLAIILGGLSALTLLVDAESMLATGQALGTVLLAFGGAIALIGQAGRVTKTAQAAMVPLLQITIGLAAILAVMANMVSIGGGVNALIPFAVALSVLLEAFAGAIVILSYAGSVSKSVAGAIDQMLLVTIGLASILTIMANMVNAGGGVQALLPSTIALSILLEAFVASIVILDQAHSISKSVAGVLIPMLNIAAGLAGILGVLAVAVNAGGGVNSLIPSTIALSVLLEAFAGAIVILGLTGPGIINAQAVMIPMLGVVAALAVILGVLAVAVKAGGGVEALLPSTIALSILLEAFAAAIFILGLTGPGVIAAEAALGPMVAVVVALAVVLGGLAYLMTIGGGVDALIPTATSLSILLIGMSAALGILSAIGPIAVLAEVAAISLVKVVGILGTLLAALGAIALIPGVQELVAGGGELLINIGKAIGGFVGAIAGGIVNGTAMAMAESLPILGSALSDFVTNAKTFFDSLSILSDPNVTTGVNALVNLILAITAANVISGLNAFLGEALGTSTLADFGEQLSGLGTALKNFANEISGMDESTLTSVQCAANCIKALAEAASTLPNEGGWAATLLGENSIATFGSYLPALGANLRDFVTNLGTFDDTTVTTVKCASDAVVALAEAAKKIPNEGGIWATLFGDNSLSTFASNLPSLGTNLASFVTNLGTFDDATVATVTCAANAIAALAKGASQINGQAEWTKIFGDNSLSAFGEDVAGTAKSIKSFADNLGTFGEDKIATVNSAVKAIKALATLADANLKGAKKQLEGFGDKLGTFASDLGTFCDNLPSAESMDAAVATIDKLLKAIADLGGADPSILTDFSSKLKKLGTDAVDKFVGAFTSDATKTDVKKAGIAMMNKLIEGMEEKDKSVKKAAEGVAKSGAKAAGAETIVSKFKSAGEDLGAGLVEGIEAKETAAYNAGYALGQAAVQGEKDGQASNSPSKLTILAGKWLGEGLVIGIGNMTKRVYNAGHNLGESATNSISNTIARIGELISSDVDSQPTIRPVLDLSNVSSGVNALNGMLDTNRTVGLMANLNSISALSNSRQNGNEDILSALNKLNKSLNNLPSGDTYSINGITYDDGSNIAGAIQTIARAAIRERRV